MSSISEALGPLPSQFRLTHTIINQVGGADSPPLCQPDPLRWALILGAPFLTNGTFTTGFIWLDSSTNAVPLGIPIQASASPFNINFRDHGTLVQQQWFGNAVNSALVHWPVIEILIQQ